MRRSVPLIFVAMLGCSSAAPSAVACEQGDETRQRAGTDCACCHAEFGVAGTARSGVARVEVDDAVGLHAVMSPNGFGNFFSHVQPVPPLAVRVVMTDGTLRTMRAPAPHGSCNACHRVGGVPGPL